MSSKLDGAKTPWYPMLYGSPWYWASSARPSQRCFAGHLMVFCWYSGLPMNHNITYYVTVKIHESHDSTFGSSPPCGNRGRYMYHVWASMLACVTWLIGSLSVSEGFSSSGLNWRSFMRELWTGYTGVISAYMYIVRNTQKITKDKYFILK